MSEPWPNFSRNHLFGCLGREQELKEVTKAWLEPDVKKRKRIYVFHGAKECGKSCAARMILEEVVRMNCKTAANICIDIDFKLEEIGPYEKEAFIETMTMKMKEIGMMIEYGNREKNVIIETVKKNKDKKTIFFFDNIDHVRDSKLDDKSCNTVSEEKDIFSDLYSKIIPAIVEINDCNFVFITSTVQIHFGRKRPRVLEIEVQHLDTEIAEKLLIIATEDAKEKIEWGPFRQPIARLCDGSPGAIITIASELVANNCFVKPLDLIINLLVRKLAVLSPELYPDEDNIKKTYLDFFEMMSALLKTRLIDLSQMAESRFSVSELKHYLTRVGKAEASEGIFKMTEVSPMLDRCILRYDSKSTNLEMPELFKEVLQVTKGQKTDERLECMEAICNRFKKIGIPLDREGLTSIITGSQEMDEIVNQRIHDAHTESKEEVPEDLQKNGAGKKFSGYSEDSFLLPREGTCSSVKSALPKQEKSDASSKQGNSDGEMLLEEPQTCLVPGQQYEHVIRAKFNASHPEWPMSMLHSPQSMAHAGLLYQGNNNFRCQYCQTLFSRSELDRALDPMKKHNESCPDCLFVQANKIKCLHSPCQVTGEEDGAVGETVKGKFIEGNASREDSTLVVDTTYCLEQDFLQQGFQEKDVKNDGDKKNPDKLENKLNLSSSFEEKTYPQNKMDVVMMEEKKCNNSDDLFGVVQVVCHTYNKFPSDSNSMEKETNLSSVKGTGKPLYQQTDHLQGSDINNLSGVDISLTEQKSLLKLEEKDLPPKSSLFSQLL